ncbi:MAG: beta-ketoacyl synthase chain length factor [Brumimicrobium sp.]|nr:beta-ketoacyl synthase chain length factor [Brumimicrobium sp.]
MKKCYINGLGCITAQNTTDAGFLENAIDHSEHFELRMLHPDYKPYIPAGALRRMSTSVKSGVLASKFAMEEAGVTELDAIITGTGLGCIQDSEKFLTSLLDNDEQYLTPTSFIQSTHNTVAGQIALGLQCKAYNVTYVNGGASFSSALLDGLMKIQNHKSNVLIGGTDELSNYTNFLYRSIHHYKDEGKAPGNILKERSVGCVPSEGSVFFVLSDQLQSSSYAELVDVTQRNRVSNDKLKPFIEQFLAYNNLSLEDIDLILLGNNGDSQFDDAYDIVEQETPQIPKAFYKHLFGDFMTAPAVSLWIAAKILKTQHLPEILLKDKANIQTPIRTILMYNQYRGKDHSLMLVRNV